jgi:hypothetical protein
MGVFPLTFRGIRGVVVYRIVSSAITATSMARLNGNRRGDRLHPTQIRFPPDHRSFAPTCGIADRASLRPTRLRRDREGQLRCTALI